MNLSEALTRQFYDWECRGRGWRVWGHPVVLEPPFIPFYRYMPSVGPAIDDGHHAGPLEKLYQFVKKRVGIPADVTIEQPSTTEEDFEPDTGYTDTQIVEIQVLLPSDTEITLDLAEQILLAFAGSMYPVSFELIGTTEGISLQFAAQESDRLTVVQILESYVPDAVITESAGKLSSIWNSGGAHRRIVDFGLANEFMLPLRTPRSFAVDPLLSFISALDRLAEGECAVLQVLFQKTAFPWAESVIRAITDDEGGAFFADAPDLLKFTAEKIASPLYACTLRVAARAVTERRNWELVRRLGSALELFNNPQSNSLLALENNGYEDEEHSTDLIERRTQRSGMLLSSLELAGIVHLPSRSVHAPALRTLPRRTKAAPPRLPSADVLLGENINRGKHVSVFVNASQRLRHTYAIGGTGTGKSTFLLHLMRQDLAAGRGIALIDPHGDLAEEVLASIPESRMGEVVVFDPSDDTCPVGFNILHARTDREREILASDLVAVFRRLSTSWGDQMTAVLGNAVMAFVSSSRGGTLLDLRRFLTDKEFREAFLPTVADPSVLAFWRREFPLLSGRPQMPIVTRLDAFLRPKAIRSVVAQRESKVDFTSVVNDGRIFIAKLSQGAIGEENAYLLGSLLTAKLHQVCLSREQIPESQRGDFFIYIDEFHNFATPSLASLLSGARKYHVGLVLAHQELRQLQDDQLQSALFANAAIRMCFRLGDDDARKLAQGINDFEATDLQNLGTGEAICRLEQAAHAFNLKIPRPVPSDPSVAIPLRDAILQRSRRRYGMPREEVDSIIAASFGDIARTAIGRSSVDKEKQKVAESTIQQNDSAVPPWESSVEPTVSPISTDAPKIRAVPIDNNLQVSPGRGGQQHKYLQSLFRQYAQDKGYKASIEFQLEDGGRIDVLLERADVSMACEISVTTTTEHEIENLQKCARGKFNRLVLVSPSQRVLKKAEALAKTTFEREAFSRMSFLTPEDFISFLDTQGTLDNPTEANVLGYRVRTTVRTPTMEERAVKKDAIVQTVLRSLRRMKEN